MPYLLRAQRIEAEKSLPLPKRKAVNEERFLQGILHDLNSPFKSPIPDSVQFGCDEQYIKVSQDPKKNEALLTLVVQPEKHDRGNYLELAKNILDNGKITKLKCSGLQAEEVATLKEIWQKFGQVVANHDMSKATNIAPSTSYPQNLDDNFTLSYSLIPFAGEEKSHELGGAASHLD
ncbi:hypothetical protein [Candidatus Tisiphia endosymbiont of Beris chalybata]|uniref:hypothetical protein n=1 Tax=Candidatus Tisiphia endosymbiont of Beris chalybata TaxID=3066262 RepID=UPI00312CA8D8